MHTDNLAVETHVVTGATPVIAKLVSAVERAGVKVDGLVLEPLASGEAVLTPEEKKKGVEEGLLDAVEQEEKQRRQRLEETERRRQLRQEEKRLFMKRKEM